MRKDVFNKGYEFVSENGHKFRLIYNKVDGEYMLLDLDTNEITARCERDMDSRETLVNLFIKI